MAACFLTLWSPWAAGPWYAIRYDYACLNRISSTATKESPDYWLEYGNPWEFPRHNTRSKCVLADVCKRKGKPVAG
ncbi:glycogen/starch/alpha-glucan phosphorylase [Shigella flexneri]